VPAIEPTVPTAEPIAEPIVFSAEFTTEPIVPFVELGHITISKAVSKGQMILLVLLRHKK